MGEKKKLNPAQHLENAMINMSDDSLGDTWLAWRAMFEVISGEMIKRNGLKADLTPAALEEYAKAMSENRPQWWREINLGKKD